MGLVEAQGDRSGARSGVRPRDAALVGVPGHHLRRVAWQRVSYGLYAPSPAPRDLRGLVRVCAEVLPADSGFGHLTSAGLRSWWLPNRLLPLHPGLLMASTRSRVHVQRHGLYVRRSDHATVEMLDDVPLMTAAETLVELARDLSLIELVPMVDCALAGGATVEQLRAGCRRRTRGVVTLRRAIELGDPRSESWWESVLRVMHVVTGLGPVESQVDLEDADGVFVGRADLHLLGTNRYPECDGGDHRTAAQHDRDLKRDKAMSRIGADRYGYTTQEISRSAAVIIRDAEAARGLEHDPSRVSTWNRLARVSTLTGHGRARLQARLARYRRAAHR
jgi:hypothetical protein